MGVMSYEETLDVSCKVVIPPRSKGALGAWRSQCGARTLSRDHAALEAGTSPLVNQRGRGVCRSVLEPRRVSGQTHGGKPRSEPDWGKPTVRDRRGACGIVVSMGAGLRPNGKLLDKPPDPAVTCAPHFYPDPQGAVVTPWTQKVTSSLRVRFRCPGPSRCLTCDVRSNMFASNVAVHRRRKGPTLERCIRSAGPRLRCRASRGHADRSIWSFSPPGVPIPDGGAGHRAAGGGRIGEHSHHCQGARGPCGRAARACSDHRFDDRQLGGTRRFGFTREGAPACLSAAGAALFVSSIASTVCGMPSWSRSTAFWFPTAPGVPVHLAA